MEVVISIVNTLSFDIKFSEKSERESLKLSGEKCGYALRPKNDTVKLRFEVSENGAIVTQGIITKDGMMILFTTTEKHSLTYIKKTKKALLDYFKKSEYKYIYTYTMRDYIESIKFLKFIGFYMSKRNGVFEKWVLAKKQ